MGPQEQVHTLVTWNSSSGVLGQWLRSWSCSSFSSLNSCWTDEAKELDEKLENGPGSDECGARITFRRGSAQTSALTLTAAKNGLSSSTDLFVGVCCKRFR